LLKGEANGIGGVSMRTLAVRLDVTLLLALTVALLVHVGSVGATSATPTYVLGVSNPLDPLILDLQSLTSQVTLLPSVSGLASIGGNSILFVDGSWLATASSLDPTVLSAVVQTALSGVPTVVVRGNPAILENSVSGLMKFPNPNLPLISDGLQITGALADGTRQATALKVIAGFDYAVSTEFQWAQQQLARAGAPITLAPLSTPSRSSGPAIVPQDTSTAPAPSWSFVIKVTTDTGDFFKPVGRVSTTFKVFRLENSGSGSFKWYNFFFNQTLQPGIQIYPGSSYRNYLEQNFVQVNNQTSNLFVAHGPAALQNAGPTVVTYSIGTQAGFMNAAVTSNQTMSYFLKNSNVTDTSSGATVSWVHSINGGTDAGKLTLQIIPGWTDRVMSGSPVDVQGSVTTTFATFSGGTVTATNSTSVQFSAFGG
jgi:hypothetical protein